MLAIMRGGHCHKDAVKESDSGGIREQAEVTRKSIEYVVFALTLGSLGGPALAQETLPATEFVGHMSRSPLLQSAHYFKSMTELQALPRDKAGSLDAIGMIRRGEDVCTGFLVSPCHVLTAAHCVFDAGDSPSTRAHVTFYYGSGTDATFTTHTGAYPVAGGWRDDKAGRTRSCGNDVVLLELMLCVPARFDHLELKPVAPWDLLLTDLSSAGILQEGDYKKSLTVDPQCWSRGPVSVGALPDTAAFAHTCAFGPGEAGAPIFQRIDNKPVVVGMNCATVGAEQKAAVADPASLTDRNFAVPVAYFYDWLADLMKHEEAGIVMRTHQPYHWDSLVPPQVSTAKKQ
jgi:secreted trypsin-like serine protease